MRSIVHGLTTAKEVFMNSLEVAKAMMLAEQACVFAYEQGKSSKTGDNRKAQEHEDQKNKILSLLREEILGSSSTEEPTDE